MSCNLTTRVKTFSSLVAASLVMLAYAASASDPAVFSKSVDYSDLNLRAAAGAKALYARIRDAAKDVCAPLAGSDLAAHTALQSCLDRAISASVTRVNSSMVTALHNDATKSARKS